MALVVFLLTYVFLAGFKLPWIKLDRTGAALVGAAAMVGLGIIPPNEVAQAIDVDTIVLLLGMMLLAAYLTRAAFFRATAYYVLRHSKTPRGLLFALVMISGVLSAFLVNDTVCLMLTPLVLMLVKSADLPPLPYLLEFFTAPIMLEFLYGAVLALAYARWPDAAPRWLAPAGLFLMAAGFAIIIALDAARVPVPNKHDARFLLLGLPAALVVAGALAMERGRWVLRQSWLLELGAASYVLYLFHPLVLQASVKLVRPLIPQAPVMAGLFALLACLAAAFVVHRIIEQPLLDWTRRVMRRRARSDPSPPAPLTIQPAE